MKNRWQLAIYDFNGTLIRDLPIAYGSVKEVFKKFSPEVEPPSLEDYRNKITSEYVDFYHGHGIPKTISGPELNSVRIPYYQGRFCDIVLNDGVVELLKFCKDRGMSNAIVSAASEEAEDIIKKLGIVDLFDSIKFKAWPKEDAFVETLKLFNVKSEDAFYIDDTADGIMAAKKLGIGTIGFTGGYNSRKRIVAAKPDFVLDSLREVETLIKV